MIIRGLLCFPLILSFGSGDRRLLLNDPDILLRRLEHVESALQILNSSFQNVVKENIQLRNTVQQQGNAILQNTNTIKQQISYFDRLELQTKGTGVTYIRWGRKQCPNNGTELVYSGYAGGSYYNNIGAAAEYVCLPPDPDFGNKTSGQDHGRMYGAEFNGNFFANDAHNEDVPCALCRATESSSVIMIPGKNKCYNGWKMEYYGYLSSGNHADDAATSYACVDINPEYIIGGLAGDYGRFFLEVVAKCGSLKCPPYKNGYPLTCVVCSK